MTITGLEPYTTYYFYAYAKNGEGETVTSGSRFTTDKYECPHESGVYTNTYPESISYINTGSATQHKEIWYFDEYCNYCDEVVNAEAVTKTYYRDHTWVNDVCKYCRYAEEETDTLDLSQTSISWGYGAGNEANVTVTYSGSYSYEIEYDVPSSVKNSEYDYEWLTVSKSGSTLNIRPKRINYAVTARSATITVTSGGQSKDITVTQAKCGESAPTIQLWRGDSTNKTVYSDGDNIGSYSLPQDNMDVSLTVSNVQKVTGYLSYKGGSRISTSTSTSMLRFDISSLVAGEYQIDVYASNSNTANDYWSQSPFADGSMTLYFSLYDESSSGETNTGNAMAAMALSLVGKSKTDLGITDQWCAKFVAYCADKANLSGTNNVFIPSSTTKIAITSSTTGKKHLLDTRINASPVVLLNQGKGNVYYYYNSYIYNNSEWVSSIGEDYQYYMTGFDTVYDDTTSRTKYNPVPVDLIFFKRSTGNPWAHVGIIVEYDSKSKLITIVDGKNSGNGTLVAGQESTNKNEGWNKYNTADSRYVNKMLISLTQKAVMAIVHPYYNMTDTTEVCDHDWGEWEGEGTTRTRYCSLCGAAQTRSFPASEIVINTISGTITSFGDEDVPVQLQLFDTSLKEVRSTTTNDGTYRMAVSKNTSYTLVISKENHVSQSYIITVDSESVTQNATLWLYGDLNKDGVVNNQDVTLFQEYFAGYTRKIPNDLADINEDGMVTRRDAMILARHVKGWKGYDTLPYTD